MIDYATTATIERLDDEEDVDLKKRTWEQRADAILYTDGQARLRRIRTVVTTHLRGVVPPRHQGTIVIGPGDKLDIRIEPVGPQGTVLARTRVRPPSSPIERQHRRYRPQARRLVQLICQELERCDDETDVGSSELVDGRGLAAGCGAGRRRRPAASATRPSRRARWRLAAAAVKRPATRSTPRILAPRDMDEGWVGPGDPRSLTDAWHVEYVLHMTFGGVRPGRPRTDSRSGPGVLGATGGASHRRRARLSEQDRAGPDGAPVGGRDPPAGGGAD